MIQKHFAGLCGLQIGQCRLHIDTKKTKEFYAILPKITQNCSCGYCKYFMEIVIQQPNKLFELLNNLGVDLSRQPNINPDGICCVGESQEGKLGYIGSYFVFGDIGITSQKDFKTEFGNSIQVEIRQVEEFKLSFEFYMDVDNKM